MLKTMSADGGHLEFLIGKKTITFVEVHPMITHATNQFHWPSAFWQEELLRLALSEHFICPWLPSWISDWHGKHNFCRGPIKDHSCKVCYKLVYWFQEKIFKHFSIRSYVKTMSVDGDKKTPNFCRVPSNNPSYNKSIQLAQCFLTRASNVSPIGTFYLPLEAMSNFRSARKTFEEHHLLNIHAKLKLIH